MISVRLLLLFCVIVWGWTFVATKVCLSYLSPYEVVGLRFAIGLPLLVVIIRLRKIRIGFARTEFKPLAFGALIIAIHFLIQAVALNYTSATNTGWIIAVTPLVLAVLSFLILRERMGRNAVIGIAVSTVGIVLLISGGDFAGIGWLSSVGDWLILASAHTWALYTIVTRNVSRSHNPLSVTFIVFLPVTVGVLLYIFLFTDFGHLAGLPVEPIIALLFLGVLGTLAQWFWQIAIAKIGAGQSGIFLYLEPIATTALAVPLLGETFGTFTAIGGILVMAGVWYAQRGNSNRRA